MSMANGVAASRNNSSSRLAISPLSTLFLYLGTHTIWHCNLCFVCAPLQYFAISSLCQNSLHYASYPLAPLRATIHLRPSKTGVFWSGKIKAAVLRVESVSIASISRIENIAWNTAARLLLSAAAAAEKFLSAMIDGYSLVELQADEIRVFLTSKRYPKWVLSSIDVSSRFWPSLVVGRRSYKNIKKLLSDTLKNAECSFPLLVATDGFVFYKKAMRTILGNACIYGQVIKTWRNNRVIDVDRKLVIGNKRQLEEALQTSEDSEKLNTSFIERLNLTIRQSLAYLARRSLTHARSQDNLASHLELLRCYYNFIRPHSALKFGKLIKTPAMQAGIATRRLSFRYIFNAVARIPVFVLNAAPIINPWHCHSLAA